VRMLEAWDAVRPPGFELVVFALPSFAAAYPSLTDRFETHIAPVSGSSKPLRVVCESLWLPFAAVRAHIAVMHHVGGRVPAVQIGPAVMTLHDLQPLDMPQNFSAIKRHFLSWSVPRSLRRAGAVMAVSEFVRRGAILRGADPLRSSVASAPAPPPRTSPDHPLRLCDEVRNALSGSAPFFVYPAISYVHKNHRTLLRAFALVRQRCVGAPAAPPAAPPAAAPTAPPAAPADVRLVLTGGPGAAEPDVRQLIDELQLGDAVLALGRVDRTDLDWLLGHAQALVFPSQYEGFGMPVVEAMALGCPVIAARSTALPEIVGDAGTLVDPDDIEAWAQAMIDRLQGLPPRLDLAARGRARLERWTAPDMVDTLVRAYRAALDDSREAHRRRRPA
jgi:glycosyltransferase involved in cell wall biosynthesis